MRIYAEKLCLMGEAYDNRVITVEDGAIVSVEPGTRGDIQCAYLSPGLWDIHLHGGQGFDVMNFAPEELGPWLQGLLRQGVTHVLPSVYTGPIQRMRDSMERICEGMRRQAAGEMPGARIEGVHLEGPFISFERPGAMDIDSILPPELARFEQIAGGYEDIVRLVTLAPETQGCGALIAALRTRGIVVQAGHTDATYDQAMEAFAAGIEGICHFFNGVRGIHHREPGILTAAMLTNSIYCELIADMVHVHPAAARLLIQSKGFDRVILISDAVKTTGLPDGEYLDNGNEIVVERGESRVKGGGLNGGGCYLSGGLRKLMKCGVQPEKAFHMACDTARAYLSEEKAMLRPGDAADLVGWDAELRPVISIAGGNIWRESGEYDGTGH